MATVHFLLAHPREDSLNAAFYRRGIEALTASGHAVLTTDVYALYKKGHAAVKPFGLPLNKKEQAEIAREQAKIKQSQLTIVQFPLYWFGFPGLLKVYWEQVLALGFAYPGKFEQSPLADGRRVLFALTTQSTQADYSAQGMNAAMEQVLMPLTLAFRFVGFAIAAPFISYAVVEQSRAALKLRLTDFEQHLLALVENNKVWLPV